ncbi:MAG: ATP-binding cassette domain-containing protein, partial [Muribaculaceae bacterium]|nr:ATP-binding cassette domain-containing protein [Muribaculaceae bacterium]
EYMEELPHEADDWNFPDRLRSLLTSLGITRHDQPMGELSGGQVKRVALARVLLGEPDILLLDEPTNHLDIDMIEWLENRLARQRTTLLMVTHDRYFLDRVCTRIIEIEGGQTYSYEGSYDYYLAKRQERHEAQDAELARVRNLLRTELEWMRRQPQARGSKAKYRINNFHDLEARSRRQRHEADVTLVMKGSYIGSKIFEAHNVAKAFGDKVILRDWSYNFARYDKVGIIGDNGTGKSTFIKMLQGYLAPDSGHFDVGTTVRFGYYSQEGIEFDESKRVIDAVREIAEAVVIDEKTTLTASQFLCRFLFPVPDQRKFIHTLSGGERRRLYLATVLMRNPNFLILDEPTNDLDIPTLAILEDYLANFKGCVIVVSHDRYFLDRVASHLFVMRGDGEIRDFPGDYSTYRHCLEHERKAVAAEQRKSDTAT